MSDYENAVEIRDEIGVGARLIVEAVDAHGEVLDRIAVALDRIAHALEGMDLSIANRG